MKLLPLALSVLLLAPLAADITTPTRIYVNASASAGGDGTTWGTAYTSLQDALTAAAASSGDDEIWVAAGTYTPDPGGTNKALKFQLASGVAIYGGFTGTESNLGDRNPDPTTNGTVLSGDLANGDPAKIDGPGFTNRSDNSSRVVETTGADATAVMDGFTIRGGKAGFSGGGAGGTGSPTFRNCRFTDNESGYAGGAVALPFGSSPSFTDCSFESNKAAFYGGAVESNSATAEFIRCSFSNNSSGFDGGAVLNYNSRNRYSACSFRGNTASNGAGSGSGGAIYIREAISPRLDNCEFTGNSAEYGGAIYTAYNSTATLTNATISGNDGMTRGGGIYNAIGASPLFSNCIIANNASAGISNILDASVVVTSGTPSFSHSIVEHSGGSSSWDPSVGLDAGSNQDADPLFTTPLDPGTAPSTDGAFTLTSGSPARDAGLGIADLDGSGAGVETIASISSDLAGNARLDGPTVDIGAYEFSTGVSPTSFASLFSGIDPTDDDNLNGRSNFLDYALGGDPTASHDASISPSTDGSTVSFTHRAGASDVTPIFRKSSDLSGWTAMQPGVDYSSASSSLSGGRVVVTLELIIAPESDPCMFFVQEFPEP